MVIDEQDIVSDLVGVGFIFIPEIITIPHGPLLNIIKGLQVVAELLRFGAAALRFHGIAGIFRLQGEFPGFHLGMQAIGSFTYILRCLTVYYGHDIARRTSRQTRNINIVGDLGGGGTRIPEYRRTHFEAI